MEAFPLTPPAQLIKPGEEYLREQTVLNMLLIHLLVYQVVTDPPSGDLKKKKSTILGGLSTGLLYLGTPYQFWNSACLFLNNTIKIQNFKFFI